MKNLRIFALLLLAFPLLVSAQRLEVRVAIRTLRVTAVWMASTSGRQLG